MAFSSQVFALQAEAPVLGTNISSGDSVLRNEISLINYREKKEKDVIDKRVEKIRAYFHRYHLPLEKEARYFVESADRYGLDWTLLPAIGMIESTGGKFACRGNSHNAFGWHSCKKSFPSYQASIDFISKSLAGKEEKTKKYYAKFKGKDVKGILETYNPPYIVSDYAAKVMREMKRIKNMKV